MSNPPTKYEYDADPKEFYTIIFSDPDVPSRTVHIASEYLHSLIYNIPGNDTSKGQVFAPYLGPGPGLGSGIHRYSFILCKQTNFLHPTEEPITKCYDDPHRPRSHALQYINKWNLEPVGISFFNCQHDDTVEARIDKFTCQKH
eukprot:gene3294-4126_t